MPTFETSTFSVFCACNILLPGTFDSPYVLPICGSMYTVADLVYSTLISIVLYASAVPQDYACMHLPVSRLFGSFAYHMYRGLPGLVFRDNNNNNVSGDICELACRPS